jgi:ribosome-binding factor A
VNRRVNRLAGEIRDEVARMIASDLKDPRLGFVTVTRVDLTPDLRYARVYVGVLGEDEKGPTVAALKGASGFIRREVGRRLRVRFSPEIDFRYDRGLDATDRVARALAEAEARDAAVVADPDPAVEGAGGDNADERED